MDANTKTPLQEHIRLSCNVLKIIACVIMAVDHVGYGILHNYMKAHAMDLLPDTYTSLNRAYDICHGIGRLAFPIFCFFIVEGFIRTGNVYKYALRLAIFAVISEVPFDLGLYGKVFYWKHQNIILTFFIAIVMLMVLRYIENNVSGFSAPVIYLTYVCAIIGFSDAAYLLGADYSWKCMLLIAVLYLARSTGPFRLIAGAAVVAWEKYAPASFVLLYFYDPDIRPRFKYAFYVFYPLHLLVIYLIAFLII